MAVNARYLSHLARRFVGSLRPGGPSAVDDQWARQHLLPGEVALWDRMSGADRRHAVGVARRAIDHLAPPPTTDSAVAPWPRSATSGSDRPARGVGVDRAVVAAALLHDVGKVEAGLGPLRRAAATIAAMAVGHQRARGWRGRPGLRGRFGRYLCHDVVGADLLRQAGSDQLTIDWARDHHLPPTRWAAPAAVGAALKAADDD